MSGSPEIYTDISRSSPLSRTLRVKKKDSGVVKSHLIHKFIWIKLINTEINR